MRWSSVKSYSKLDPSGFEPIGRSAGVWPDFVNYPGFVTIVGYFYSIRGV
jgi:hypothetical protein